MGYGNLRIRCTIFEKLAQEGRFEGLRREQLDQPEEEGNEPWDREKETSEQPLGLGEQEPFGIGSQQHVPARQVFDWLRKHKMDIEDFEYEMGERDWYEVDEILDYISRWAGQGTYPQKP